MSNNAANNQATAANQVFVRNLPFDVTEEDLTKIFEEVGPLKNVSIAKDPSGRSRGFGFVKFALEEDAKATITKLQDFDVKGRRIKVELGLKKDNDPKKRKRENDNTANTTTTVTTQQPSTSTKEDTKPQKTLKVPQKPAAASTTTSASNNSNKKDSSVSAATAAVTTAATAADDAAESISRSRQVLVFGIPLDVNKKIFSRVVDKIVRKVKVEFVTEGHAVSESALITYPVGKVILLTTNSRPEAQKIVEALNKETIGGLGFGKFNFSDDAIGSNKAPAVVSADSATTDKTAAAVSEAEAVAEDANEAVTEMFKTKNMLKQRLIARLHSEVTPLSHRKKRCRLIIRNLSFQARDLHIMDKMKRFGPIVEIDLPITVTEKPVKKRANNAKDPEDKDNKSNTTLKQVESHRGFAFITFLCENDAKTAVTESTAAGKVLKVCNREVAVDHCYSKDTYLKFGNNPPAGPEEDEAEGATATAAVDGKDHEDKEKNVKDSKKKGAETTTDNDDSGSDEEEDDEEDDDDDDDDQDNEEDEDEDDDGSLEEDNGSDLDSDSDDNDEDDDDEEKKIVDKNDYVSNAKNQRLIGGDVNEGRTLFLRNLAYDMTADDIKAVLTRYGRIELALVVMDRATGMSKGSAFVKFADASSCERCLKECEVSGVEIKHKTVKVARAIDKDSAEKIKQGQKPGKDKRNMYLANEGLALDGDATAHMNEHDREKRVRAQADKKKKLQNPLFFVSHERLSIRNIAKHVKDHDLKILCLKATKAGLAKDLVSIQDMQNLQQAQGPELFDGALAASPTSSITPSSSSSSSPSSSSTVKLRSINEYSLQDLRSLPTFDSKTCIRQAKVILNLDRVAKSPASSTSSSSSAPSRGYGFVEFSHHAFALACLRELNNNAAYEHMAQQVSSAGKDNNGSSSNKEKTRLIAEFSLENIRKVKILKDRKTRIETRRAENHAKGTASAEEKLARKKEKRRLQREQKRLKLQPASAVAVAVADSASASVASAPVAESSNNNKGSKKRKREEEEEEEQPHKSNTVKQSNNSNNSNSEKKQKKVTIVTENNDKKSLKNKKH